MKQSHIRQGRSWPKSATARLFTGRLAALLILILAAVLILFTLLELKNTRDELIGALQEQAHTIMDIAQQGYESAEHSFSYVEELLAQRLLDNARILEEMDYQGLLSGDLLEHIAQQNNLFRVHVFDRNGRLLLSNLPAGSGMPVEAPRLLLQDVLSDSLNELVLGFRGRAFGPANRYAVARQRRRGGAIVVNGDASQMLEFRRAIGPGAFIRKTGATPGVCYAVVQDSTEVLLASEGVPGMEAISEDVFLWTALASSEPATRFDFFQDSEVLEIVQTVFVQDGRRALMRIGLFTTHLRETEAQARKRVWLLSFLLLALGALAGGGLIGLQYYRDLRTAYTRVEGYAQGILANMSDAVIAVNRAGEVLLFNRAAETLLGVTFASVIAKTCEAWPEICTWLEKTIASGEHQEIEAATLIIGNQERFIQASVQAVRDPQQVVDMAFIVIRDRTENRYLEEQVRRHEQITAMGHLAAGVAHEIRNPLNAIVMIAQRLRREFTPREAADEYGALTGTLHDEAKRINEIIQQFLTFAKPAPLKGAAVELQELVNRAAALMRSEAQLRQIAITTACQPDARVWGDGSKLQQVLLNLLHNSLAACQPGGAIHVECAVDKSHVRLSVADDGAGIAEENLDKIFNLYFTTRESGSGLGLSIVQQIISQHNGSIDVSSQEGQGTRISITLPLHEADAL